MTDLKGRNVAILATDGFEQAELMEPRRALEEAGATVKVIAPKGGRISGWDETDWGAEVDVDVKLSEAKGEDYDALVLPGGVMNPDKLRMEADAVRLVRTFFEAGKPVAAICHAPWLLVEAGVADGRTMTGYRTIRTDLRNAGATVVDEEVVVDDGLVTSRNPDDIPAFCEKMIEAFAEGRHRGQSQSAGESPRPAAH